MQRAACTGCATIPAVAVWAETGQFFLSQREKGLVGSRNEVITHQEQGRLFAILAAPCISICQCAAHTRASQQPSPILCSMASFVRHEVLSPLVLVLLQQLC